MPKSEKIPGEFEDEVRKEDRVLFFFQTTYFESEGGVKKKSIFFLKTPISALYKGVRYNFY